MRERPIPRKRLAQFSKSCPGCSHSIGSHGVQSSLLSIFGATEIAVLTQVLTHPVKQVSGIRRKARKFRADWNDIRDYRWLKFDDSHGTLVGLVKKRWLPTLLDAHNNPRRGFPFRFIWCRCSLSGPKTATLFDLQLELYLFTMEEYGFEQNICTNHATSIGRANYSHRKYFETKVSIILRDSESPQYFLCLKSTVSGMIGSPAIHQHQLC